MEEVIGMVYLKDAVVGGMPKLSGYDYDKTLEFLEDAVIPSMMKSCDGGYRDDIIVYHNQTQVPGKYFVSRLGGMKIGTISVRKRDSRISYTGLYDGSIKDALEGHGVRIKKKKSKVYKEHLDGIIKSINDATVKLTNSSNFFIVTNPNRPGVLEVNYVKEKSGRKLLGTVRVKGGRPVYTGFMDKAMEEIFSDNGIDTEDCIRHL